MMLSLLHRPTCIFLRRNVEVFLLSRQLHYL